MKNFAVLVLIFLLSFAAFAQKPAKKKPSAAPKPVVNAGNEKEEFEKAVAVADASERIAALQKFIENFPKSAEKVRAQELVVSARAAVGDEKLRMNETASGVEFFRLAVKDAPQPMSDKIFSELIINFPTNLFWRGQRAEALEIAQMIEAKADGNANQLLGLATYYLGTENASEAKRIAEKAIALDANQRSAYQTLGLAYRLNFELEESANAYQKALELDTNSIVSRRSLAEMKRATGKADEAAALYREILEKDAADGLAQTGLILSLFGAEKRAEAETEMSKAFEANPNNLVLLVGAAYWYAAHNNGARAVEMAQKAVGIEPRYTWAHIALARGFLQQKRPLDAERALLAARQYGNFPTLDYEIASARLQAGFFREAADILKTSFEIDGENIKTKLGGRVVKSATNFTDLLALERRASIFEPIAADDAENANKLKSLLDLNRKIEAGGDEEIALAADEFVRGEDKMKVHRGLYAANTLLKNKKALPKALELAQSAVGKTDSALDVPNASAAVLADELYESRTISMSRNQFVIVPNVPRPTLSAILRGRIEEIAGWTYYQQNQPKEAAVRLKRAVSVLPEKSAFWRSGMWRLGAALEADGKEKEALDSYIKSYPADAPDNLKYGIIESLYRKVNGSADGLEARIGAKPASPIIAASEPEKIEKIETVAQNAEPVNQSNTQTPETNAPKSEAVSAPETKSEPIPAAETTTEVKTETEPKPEPTEEKQPQTETPKPLEVSEQATAPPTNPVSEVAPQPEEKIENKRETLVVVKTDLPEPKQTETPETDGDSNEKPKSIFDPVIITVPKRDLLKTPNPKIAEPESEKIPDEKPPVKTDEKPAAETGSGLSRPRVVVEDRLNDSGRCSITINQKNIEIMNGGGSLGILVGFENSGDANEIRAFSENPNDVEITRDPEVGALSGRAFFIVKSISSKIGKFRITFEAPCGKREITVKIR